MSGRSDLGLPEDATVDDVKKRFRERAKVAHPDTGGNAGMFTRLRDAYGRALSERPRSKNLGVCSFCGGTGLSSKPLLDLEAGFAVKCSLCGGTGVARERTVRPGGGAYGSVFTNAADGGPTFRYEDVRRAYEEFARTVADHVRRRAAELDHEIRHGVDCRCDEYRPIRDPGPPPVDPTKDREDRAAAKKKHAWATCEDCGGKGYGASSKRTCRGCGGNGKRLRPGTCYRCLGGGLVTVYVLGEKKDTRAVASSVTCPSCEGTGKTTGAGAAR